MLPNLDRLALPNCIREPGEQDNKTETEAQKGSISERDFRGIFLNRHAHARHQKQQQLSNENKNHSQKLSDLLFYDHVQPFPLNHISWQDWCGSKRDVRCFQCAKWVTDVYPLCVPIDHEMKYEVKCEMHVWKMRPHFAHWKCLYSYVNTRYNAFASRSVGLITLMAIRLYGLNPFELVKEKRIFRKNAHAPSLINTHLSNHIIRMEEAHITVQDVYKSIPQTTSGSGGGGGGGDGSGGAAHDDDDDV